MTTQPPRLPVRSAVAIAVRVMEQRHKPGRLHDQADAIIEHLRTLGYEIMAVEEKE